MKIFRIFWKKTSIEYTKEHQKEVAIFVTVWKLLIKNLQAPLTVKWLVGFVFPSVQWKQMISMGNILKLVLQVLLPKLIVLFNATKSRYSWELSFFLKFSTKKQNNRKCIIHMFLRERDTFYLLVKVKKLYCKVGCITLDLIQCY